MLTVLYIIALTVGFFWLGLYMGKGYRPTRRSLTFTLPPDAHLFRAVGPPRRTERVNLSLPILVTGADPGGEKFDESTHTITISGYGAAIVLKHQVKLGQEIAIHRADSSREASVRILHELARSPEGKVYGVAFVDPTADLWGACQLLTAAIQQRDEKASSQAAAPAP